MVFVDTHTHLYDEVFENGGEDAVARAIEAGVVHMIFPGTSVDEFSPMKALAAKFPENVSMVIGLHPTELTDNPAMALKAVERELADPSVHYVGVGEIGIDLYCCIVATDSTRPLKFLRDCRRCRRVCSTVSGAPGPMLSASGWSGISISASTE